MSKSNDPKNGDKPAKPNPVFGKLQFSHQWRQSVAKTGILIVDIHFGPWRDPPNPRWSRRKSMRNSHKLRQI
jgi:hypothetical protein